MVSIFLLPALAIAGKPIFLISAINKTPNILVEKQTVLAKYKVTNNSPYQLNNNALTNPSNGIKQVVKGQGTCQHTFNLAPGASCILLLEINADKMTGPIQGGPRICHNKNNPVYCSLPSPQDVLSIRKIPEIDAILNKPQYENAVWGLRVVDLNTGEVIINLRPNYNFFIGSVRKIFSVGEFLSQVGSDYKFRTPVAYQGTIDADGILHGDLILVASGDLTMGGRRLPNNKMAVTDLDHNEANSLGNAILTKPDPLAGYKLLAKRVYNAGIRHVTGEVIIDESLFVPFNFRNEFNVSPIFVNDDVIDVIINPTSVGQLASVNWRPRSAAFTIESSLMTTGTGTDATYELEPEFPACIGQLSCKGLVTGNLPTDFTPPLTNQFPLVQTFRIVEPANYARTTFIEALQNAGVSVDALTVAPNPPKPTGVYTPITELVSLPLAEYTRFILKISYNIGADTSLVLFGLTQGVNNMADALTIERNRLINLYHIPGDQFFFPDGSGGGDTTATTVAVTKWLTIMAQNRVFPTFFNSLPILGVDGSLALITAFQKNASLRAATGNIRAKTGTYVVGTPNGLLLNGQSFAGYINAKSGRSLIYQLVINNVAINSIDDLIQVIQDEGTISAILWRDL